MSKVVIQGDTNGTGVFTVASPNSNTDRTLTLPDEAGTIITSGSPTVLPKGGPAFSAYRSTSDQSFSSSTWTKLQYQTELYDTNSCYDNSTNYRFTPNIEGYYIFIIGAYLNGSTNPSVSGLSLYKNGSYYRYGPVNYFSWGVSGTITGSHSAYMNGTTDYVEAYIYSNGTSPLVGASSAQSFFEGYLVRGV